MKRRLFWIVFVTALAATIAAVILGRMFFFNPDRIFQITETYRIESAEGAETFLNVCLPASTSYQSVSDFQVDGVEGYQITTCDGWAELVAAVTADGSENLVTISYSVQLLRDAEPWDGPVLNAYAEPQQYIDSDAAAVIEQAETLRADNDYETARNIFRFTHTTIQPIRSQRINEEQASASELLVEPVGGCNDYAILMVALLRADGIPAKKIDGLSLQLPLGRAGDWTHPGGAHAWVEFYVDGKWHFADPTWGLFDKTDTAHLSYGTFESTLSSDFQQNRMLQVEQSGYILVGAMSAPLKFMVYSTDPDATVTPRVEVGFTWFGF